MSWDPAKHDPMLLEYVAARTFFGKIGYDQDSILPIFSDTDFRIQVRWQEKVTEIRVGSIGNMSASQLQEKFFLLVNDWNQYASQADRERVWQASEMKRRASEILLALLSQGFPIFQRN